LEGLIRPFPKKNFRKKLSVLVSKNQNHNQSENQTHKESSAYIKVFRWVLNEYNPHNQKARDKSGHCFTFLEYLKGTYGAL